jgi:hypothetical protein
VPQHPLPGGLTPDNWVAKKRIADDTTDSGSCTQKEPNARLRTRPALDPRVSALTGTSPAEARTDSCVEGGGTGGARVGIWRQDF